MKRNYLLFLILLMLLPGCYKWSCTPRFMNRVRPCGHVGTASYCTPETQGQPNIVYQENDITYPNGVTPEVASTEIQQIPIEQEITTDSGLLPEHTETTEFTQDETGQRFTDDFQQEYLEEPELTQEEVIKKTDEQMEQEAENDVFEDIERANAIDEEMSPKSEEEAAQETPEDFTATIEEDTVNIKEENSDNNETKEIAQADTIDPVLFDFDKRGITDKQEQALAKNIEKIKKMAENGFKIVIAGHACHSAGKDWYNEKISQQRAQAVASYLKDKGVKEDSIIIEAHGSRDPIVLEGNSRKQAPNRRVEIHV